MVKITLSNNRETEVKKLGARSQARAIDCIREMLPFVDLSKVAGLSTDDPNLTAITEVALSLIGEHFDLIERFIVTVSDLTAAEIGVDGDGAIGVVDLAIIAAMSFKINDIAEQMERLGNALGPSGGQAGGQETSDPGAGQAPPTASKSGLSMYSPHRMAGLRTG